jgi:tRNA1(Val) A37 N6-methylase TrmN6
MDQRNKYLRFENIVDKEHSDRGLVDTWETNGNFLVIILENRMKFSEDGVLLNSFRGFP